MSSNIIQEESVQGMLNGISKATSVLRGTYGGFGKNVIVESNRYPYHQVVNDCETIIQAIKLTDPAEKRGLAFLQELSTKQDKLSGNGRKTTIIMAEEILKEGYKSSLNKLQLKRDLDALIPFIESKIDKQIKQITVDEVYGVAKTASESEETGKLMQEIYQKIGKNGIISIEGSGTYETTYKITNGVRFEMTGMLSPEMVHDEESIKDKRKETKAVYEKPWILVTKKKITTDDDINPLLIELRNQEKKDLVIFTNDMDSGVASMLVNLHKSKDFNILIIKAPVLWQNMVFEDFAKCVGATVVEDATGISFKNLQLKHLGTCGRIEVDQEDTVLTGISDITEHLNILKAKGDDDSNLRLSWLATKSAMLKLGANSQTDLSYKRLKANDANRSTYLALQYGVVKGGGLCLYEIGYHLYSSTVEPIMMGDAVNILSKALQAPLEQAMANYGLGEEDYTKLITEDIVDASAVIKRAVRNAVGIASTILTAPSLVYIPELTPTEMSYQIAMKQSNPFGQN